jgi:hypothetical protein
MVFKATIDGNRDPNINRKGRIKKLKNPRDIRNAELLNVLRKIKPHVSKAIVTAADIMQDARAPTASKLKAAQLLLANYRDLVLDLYDGEEPEEGIEEIQEQSTEPAKVFSLRMLPDDSDDDSNADNNEVQE